MKTFVINLERSTGRKQYMADLLQSVGIDDYEFLKAVDGRSLTQSEVDEVFDTKTSFKRYGRDLSRGEIGCTLSHFKCYRRIVDNDINCALILEDNISILRDIPLFDELEKFMNTTTPMVVFLSGDFWYYKRKQFKMYNLASVFDAVGTYAYAINISAAKLIIENNFKPSNVADSWSLYRSQGINLKAFYPYVIDANIEEFESTIIQNKFCEIRSNMSLQMKVKAYWVGLRKRLLYTMGGYVAKQRIPLVKKKKIICINQAPLNPRSKRLSYVDTFIDAGYDFEYWDMTKYFKQSPQNVDSQIASAHYVKELSNLQEVKQAFVRTDCRNSCFFIGVPERWENRKFFKLLNDYNCRVLRSDPCANTMVIKKDTSDYINFLLSPSKILSFVKRIMLKLYFRHNDIHYDDVFSSSKLSNRTVKINHPDYDDFFRLQKSSDFKLPTERYAVFYDSYFPLHPDFKLIHKLKVEVDYQNYLKSMNSFFRAIEEKYDLEVVIAAHPTASYSESDFEGRKIIKWHTCELTQGAQIVINQSSNSTSFAMLADKPIIFITSDEVEKCTYLSRYITVLSSMLGKEKYNIDHCDIKDVNVDRVQADLRFEYIYTYLTDPETEHMTNEEIYASYVRRKLNL